MNLLSKIQNKYIIAKSEEGSCDSNIEKLLHFSTIEVPHEYIEIIKEKTEIEIEINKKKYLRIWGAEGCMEMNEVYNIQKYIPKSLAIGDDECCNALLYAHGNNGFGLYIVSLSDLDINGMKYIADSLESFFVKENGIDIFNNVW